MAVATLIETQGSSPLEVGTRMLIDGDDNIEGSVTGGCVEGALVEEVHQVLAGREVASS
jgi:xanthine/CO dehydrogenase XdhC/CoxF family maturation factor